MMGENLPLECPNCGREYRYGMLFCEGCGLCLITDSALEKDTISLGKGEGISTSDLSSQGDRTGGRSGHVLRLRVLSTGRQIQVPAISRVLIGRLDISRSIFPDIDLTLDGGLEGGVSRRHCEIHYCDGQYFIEDVGSTNGTFLNGEALLPHLPHVLKGGDELQLGRVRLQVIVL